MGREQTIKQKIFTFLASYPVQFLCRLILGGLFIYASIDKIVNPHAFARIIHNYKLVPDIFIYAMAITFPWIELIAGLFLVSGIYKRTAAIILSGMLTVFSIAISINLIRGLKFDCGCFSTSLTESGSDPVGLLIRDILILIPGIIIIFFQKSSDRK
ncbi:MAG TPA: MauE/DoxX family redox-associated membrane protein [Candidatus Kapabacteria bacterium]|nr:MauE/DoxX family redox-associated membrane protein [Candidatus Kapabacteria bacterium]